MPGGSGLPDRGSPLRFHRTFMAVVAALVLAVGVCASAGLIGISALHRTVLQVAEDDARRLLVVTHVRRLFRSELLLQEKVRASETGALRQTLERQRLDLRAERGRLLAELEDLLLPEERRELAVLRQQHERSADLLHQREQPWEAAVASILSTTEARLALATQQSADEYRAAMALLVGASLVAAALGLGLGASAVRSIRRASDILWANEDRLRHAQRLESIGRLAGGVAHDFNNLLTVIRGHASMLEQEFAPGAPARDDIDSILTTVDRAAGLTRQLLAFSRRQAIRCQVVDLATFTDGMRGLLSQVVGAGVRLSIRSDGQPAPCSLDPTQVEQILMNLAMNAAHAMPAGGSLSIAVDSVEVTAGEPRGDPALAPGVYVRLTVRDTGTGMSPEVQRRAFEPFFTTKPLGEGTGLGLSVVHGAVTQQGGQIALFSEEGVGTTFRIFWPRVPEPDLGRNAAAVTAPTAAQAAQAALER